MDRLRSIAHVFGALVEFERDLIGSARWRARGCPNRGARQQPSGGLRRKLRVALDMYNSREHNVATIARVVGVSRASLYRALSNDGTGEPSLVPAQVAGTGANAAVCWSPAEGDRHAAVRLASAVVEPPGPHLGPLPRLPVHVIARQGEQLSCEEAGLEHGAEQGHVSHVEEGPPGGGAPGLHSIERVGRGLEAAAPAGNDTAQASDSSRRSSTRRNGQHGFQSIRGYSDVLWQSHAGG
jgi:hypothetical protein